MKLHVRQPSDLNNNALAEEVEHKFIEGQGNLNCCYCCLFFLSSAKEVNLNNFHPTVLAAANNCTCTYI